MERLKQTGIKGLKWIEKYTKTDMVYLIKSSFWLNLNMVIVTVFSFILSITFAHFLSKEEYGTYQFVLSIASIIGALTLTGMNTSVIQAVARGFEGSLKRSVLVQLAWGVIPFITSIGVSAYYLLQGNNPLSIAFVLVAIFLPLLNAFNTYASFLIGKKDFRSAMFFAQIVNVFYYGSMFVALLSSHSNALILIAINFGVNTAATLLCYFLILRKFKPNHHEDPHAISYGKHLSFLNIFSTVASQIDNVVVFHFLGAAQLAIYAFASIVPERLGGVIKSVMLVSFPKLSTRTHKELKENMIKKTLQLTVGACILFTAYILISPLIYNIFFPKYIESIKISQAYALVVVLTMSSGIINTYLQAIRATRQLYILNTTGSIIQVVMIFFFGMFYGILGVIIARIISSIISIFLGVGLFYTIPIQKTT